jgi:hypothetical protein
MIEMRNVYKICVEKSEGKRPLLRTKRRWEVLFKLILGEYGGNLWTGFMWLRIGAGCRLL